MRAAGPGSTAEERLVTVVLLAPCGCSHPGRILGNAEGQLLMPSGFTVVFNHREDRSYRSPLTDAERPGEDLEGLMLARP